MQIPEVIKTISIDLETYSSVPIKNGVYPYAESPDSEILLFAYSINGEPVVVIDVASGEEIPEYILKALTDDTVEKWAFNAAFERIFLSYWLKRNHPEYFKSYSIPEDSVDNYLDPSSWKCSMIWSAYMGLPLSLEGVGAVLGLEEQKLKEGKDLIRYFCVPCKPTKANGGRTRNMPSDAPDNREIPVALIHPASAGHGLNLQQGGNTMVWFGIIWSLELYQQCVCRLYRQGQTEGTVTIIHLISQGTIDEKIMKALSEKDNTQASLIDAVKAEI